MATWSRSISLQMLNGLNQPKFRNMPERRKFEHVEDRYHKHAPTHRGLTSKRYLGSNMNRSMVSPGHGGGCTKNSGSFAIFPGANRGSRFRGTLSVPSPPPCSAFSGPKRRSSDACLCSMYLFASCNPSKIASGSFGPFQRAFSSEALFSPRVPFLLLLLGAAWLFTGPSRRALQDLKSDSRDSSFSSELRRALRRSAREASFLLGRKRSRLTESLQKGGQEDVTGKEKFHDFKIQENCGYNRELVDFRKPRHKFADSLFVSMRDFFFVAVGENPAVDRAAGKDRDAK